MSIRIVAIAIILVLSIGFARAQKCFNGMEDYLSQLPTSKTFTDVNVDSLPNGRQKFLQSLVGCEAPEFSLVDTRHEKLTLSSLKGRVVVINFWQIDSPNIAQIPALNKLTAEYKNKDVVFISFGRDNLPNILGFLRTTKFDYHVIPIDEEFAKMYCVMGMGLPMNMVLDKNGIVRKVFNGARIDDTASTWAYEEMKPVIDECLEN